MPTENVYRITLTNLAKAKQVNTSTVWRWSQVGVRGVKLETFFVGGRIYTTEAMYQEFQNAIQAASRNQARPAPAGPKDRNRAKANARKAERALSGRK